MAKITITLEDHHDDSGKPTVSLDMSGARVGPFGQTSQTEALRISQMLFGMAACEESLGALPACRRQPSNTTLH
ncbi:hypothetical protein BLL42_11460 [Pseudomonas frederiksbergensis]|uniref:Uncharacterized protein n=1 Tax=Pseudomonas frederiksbergensis TaxID=104087 RepID=A0A1J0EJS6_9PSED|nr:hypothetical protein [Pseudomonas frederiksbergensis]APC16313.1 hypothetical protein BLL42_11460 [Pseudomonas frederiksbergensis]